MVGIRPFLLCSSCLYKGGRNPPISFLFSVFVYILVAQVGCTSVAGIHPFLFSVYVCVFVKICRCGRNPPISILFCIYRCGRNPPISYLFSVYVFVLVLKFGCTSVAGIRPFHFCFSVYSCTMWLYIHESTHFISAFCVLVLWLIHRHLTQPLKCVSRSYSCLQMSCNHDIV